MWHKTGKSGVLFLDLTCVVVSRSYSLHACFPVSKMGLIILNYLTRVL